MKHTTLLPLPGLILLMACNANRPQTIAETPKTDIADTNSRPQLEARLKEMDVPSQFFKAPADRPSMIKGRKGTVVFIAPADLETYDGQAPTEPIEVELKELASRSDLVASDAQTVSNGNLLVSGGSYFIDMTSGAKHLRLKGSKTLKIALPRNGTSDMSLYYGEREKTGRMNWQPAQKLAINGYADEFSDSSIMVLDDRNYHLLGYVGNDSTYRRDTAMLRMNKRKWLIGKDSIAYIHDSMREVKEQAGARLNSTLYNVTEIKRMGWVNCDRLYRGAPLGDITYTIASRDSIVYAHVYIVFKEVRSMIDNVYYAVEGQNTKSMGALPVGAPARLVAVAYRRGQLLTCSMDMTIAANQHTVIVWKPTAEAGALFKVD